MGMMIKGQQTALREKRLSDAANDYRWRVDPELCRLDATVPLTANFSDFLLFYQEELQYPSPRRQRFAIEAQDDKHIGNCMLYDIDLVRGQAELGVMIGDRDYWDQGYGTDAVKALLDYAFNTLHLQRVYLHTLEWNRRAHAAFTKAGFISIGPVRRDGYTFIQMELRRQRWEQLHRQGTKADFSATKSSQ